MTRLVAQQKAEQQTRAPLYVSSALPAGTARGRR
jgi:hypothetical protein